MFERNVCSLTIAKWTTEMGLVSKPWCCAQVYDTLTKNVMQPSGVSGEASLSNAQRVAAGCMSGMSACVVVFPLETLRTHAAMGNVKLKGAGAYFRMAAAITRCA